MCTKKITDALINDCSVDPVLGLKSGVIINYDDLDFASITVEGSVISVLQLKAGAVGYPVSWLKRMGGNNNSLVASATERQGYTHSFACQLAGFSAMNAERIKELENGRFVLVAESNFLGAANVDAYKVFGFTTGLHLTEAVHNSNENSGAITYVLSTQEGNKEKYLYNTLLETTYEATKADYDLLFAQA